MASLIYKKLFEVLVLHDYYLVKANQDASNTSYFTLNDTEKEALLTNILNLDKYKNTDFFGIQLPKSTEALFKQYHFRLVPTDLGFFLGMEVKQEVKVDPVTGTEFITYKPFFTPPSSTHLQFIILNKDAALPSIAILPSPSPYKAKYYFTNRNTTGSKSFPALSEGTDGTIHVDDLGLLPFRISIPSISGTTLKVELLNQDGESIVVKEKLVTSSKSIINLRDIGYTEEEQLPISDGRYFLKIEENASLILEKEFFFSNELYRQTNWGILDFFFDAQNDDYNLLDISGNLKTRLEISATGMRTTTPHPVFELRIEGIFT